MNFFRAALSHLKWRHGATASLLAGSVILRVLIQEPSDALTLRATLPYAMIKLTEAFLVLLGVLCAEEAERRGVRTRWAFGGALLASCLLTAAFLKLYRSLVLDPEAPLVPHVASGSIDVWVFGGLMVLAYVNRRSATRMLEGVRKSELKCVQAEHELIDSRLAAFRAQIDQPAFFSALTDVRNAYQAGLPDAGERLDDLIQQLREGRANLRSDPSCGVS